ncbi:MAG: hypothetical protein KBH01_06280 [Breznakibacter sp.]|nr:hypothetical protein [Breznakibacter sp.]
MKKLYCFISIFCFVLGWQHLTAQYYTFRGYSLEQGLPQSEINAITDDHFGYLWVGTNGGGLCRFDGRSFDVFDKKQGLPDNVVLSLFQDSRAFLWIATPKGIVRYDGLNMHPILEADTTIIGGEFKFFETSDGAIWFVTQMREGKRALYAIQGDSVVSGKDIFPEVLRGNDLYYANGWGRKRIILSTKNGLYTIDNRDIQLDALNKRVPGGNQIVIPLLEDRMKRVWLYVLDEKRQATIYTLDTRGELATVLLPKGVSANRLINLFEDRDGGLWTSVLLEGLMYNKGDVATFFNQGNGLPSSIIHHIFQDREGNFWFGSSGEGLIRYSSNFFTSFNETNGLTDNLIMRIFEDSKGVKYFCDGRGGLNIFDGNQLKTIAAAEKPAVGVLRGYCEISPGRHLFSSDRGLWMFDGSRFTEVSEKYGLSRGVPVLDILQDGDTLLIGTFFNGLLKSYRGRIVKQYHTSNSSLLSNQVHHLFFDRQHRLWISTSKGVSVLRNDTIVSYGENNGLKAPSVLQVTEDKAGNIWMANFTGGLVRFDGKNFKAYDSENGLKTDVVYSLLTDQSGNIWAGSQLGVDQLVINSAGEVTDIYNFDRYDGFLGIENNSTSALCDKHGVLWFGTIKGVMRCIPGERIINQLPPAVFVDEVNLNSLQTNWLSEPYIGFCDSIKPWHKVPVGLNLNSNYNHISFSFDALCYTQPEKVLYRWKLDPVDQDYCPPSSHSTATYTMLPPGKYKFHVMACNNDGIWNEEGDTFEFEVTAAWWNRPFVRFVFWVLLGLLAVLCIMLRRRQVLKHRQELDVLVLSKQQEVNRYRSKLAAMVEDVEQHKIEETLLTQKVALSAIHFSMVSELVQMIHDNLAEARVVSAIHQLMENAVKSDFFSFACLDPAADALVFRYAVQRSERLPLFSYPADDLARLPVFCAQRRQAVFIHDWQEEKHQYVSENRVVPGGFNALSIIIVPFTLADRTTGVLIVQSELKSAYTDYHYQLLKLVASLLSGYRL